MKEKHINNIISTSLSERQGQYFKQLKYCIDENNIRIQSIVREEEMKITTFLVALTNTKVELI